MATVYTHGECGAQWTGLRTAHCGACHRTFSGETAANKHRRGEYGGGRYCADPATVGLIDHDGTWRLPASANPPWWR